MSKVRKGIVGRRDFLKTAATSAAVAVAAPGMAGAQEAPAAPPQNATAPVPSRPGPAAEGLVSEAKIIERPG